MFLTNNAKKLLINKIRIDESTNKQHFLCPFDQIDKNLNFYKKYLYLRY